MAEVRAAAGAAGVVGREAEDSQIGRALAAVTGGVRAVAVRGEPGAGKTTLWRRAVERCRRDGYTVLTARPAEEEMSLALGGLVDLFEDVDGAAPELRAEGDVLARGRLVLETLRTSAREAPTLVAIDDVQWLDSASSRRSA